jgi:hypothetical protein
VTIPPLLFLTLCSIRNQIRVRLRRLRQPRYLIASVLGLSYFWFLVLGRGFRRGRGRPGGMPGLPVQARVGLEVGASMFLFVLAAAAWIMPASKRPALAFTRSEVQYLFTAPIPRRRLVRYRVLRSQIGAVVGSIVITLLFRGGSQGRGFTTFVGIAVIMAILNLYSTGVSLSRASVGIRRSLPRTVAVAAVVVIAATLTSRWNEITTAFLSGDFDHIHRVSTAGAAGIVLWPFRTLVQLPLAQSTGAFLAALPWALLMIVLAYQWVVRTNVPFEEASAELSEKIDDMRRRGLSALRTPRKTAKTPFNLPSIGRPETAIVWKNLISMGRVLSWTMMIRLVPMTLALAAVMSTSRRRNANGALTVLCLMVAAFTVILGPQILRRDLRQDLGALAILKTWPIRGASLVRGEVLAPAIVLTVIASIALVAAAVLSASLPPVAAALPSRWSLLLAALFIVPGIVLAQLVAQNGLAVTFPSWVSLDPRPGGVDAVGQGLLVMLAVLLALLAAVVPAALVAAVIAGVLYLLLGTVPIVLPGALAGLALLVEAFIGTEVIGAILERSDISAVDARET